MYINEREIWLVDFCPTKGIEISKVRPVLIIKKFSSDHFVVLPITSKKKPNYLSFILENISFLSHKISYINISQVRTLDKQRFIRRFGKLPYNLFSKILKKTAVVYNLLPQGPIGHNVN